VIILDIADTIAAMKVFRKYQYFTYAKCTSLLLPAVFVCSHLPPALYDVAVSYFFSSHISSLERKHERGKDGV